MSVCDKLQPRVALLVTGLLLVLGLGHTTMAKELTVMHCWTPPRQAAVDAMFEEFMKLHPGVEVKTQLVSNCNNLNESFLTNYMGGVSPDLVMIKALDIPASVESGVLAPITARMAKDALALDKWFPAEIESARWQGDIYGLPMRTGGDANSLMFYNIEVLEGAGYGTTPKTWEELYAMTKKLVRYDGDGTLVRAGLLLQGGDLYSTAWLAAGGGSLYSADGKQALFGNEKSINALSYLGDIFGGMYRQGLLEAEKIIGTTQAKRRAAFISGALPFNFEGSWEFTLLQNAAPDLRYGVTLRPTLEKDGKPGIHAGTFHYAMPKGTANPDLAWELLKFITLKEETAGTFMFDQNRPSPVIEFSRNSRYWNVNPYWPVIIDALMKVDFLPSYPFTNEVSVMFGDALRSITRGQSAAVSTLEETTRRVQAVIDQYWSKK